MNIENLGDEPMLHIFGYLNHRELAACCQVSSYFNEIASADFLWRRFEINKQAAGFPVRRAPPHHQLNDTQQFQRKTSDLSLAWTTPDVVANLRKSQETHESFSLQSSLLHTAPTTNSSKNSDSFNQNTNSGTLQNTNSGTLQNTNRPPRSLPINSIHQPLEENQSENQNDPSNRPDNLGLYRYNQHGGFPLAHLFRFNSQFSLTLNVEEDDDDDQIESAEESAQEILQRNQNDQTVYGFLPKSHPSLLQYHLSDSQNSPEEIQHMSEKEKLALQRLCKKQEKEDIQRKKWELFFTICGQAHPSSIKQYSQEVPTADYIFQSPTQIANTINPLLLKLSFDEAVLLSCGWTSSEDGFWMSLVQNLKNFWISKDLPDTMEIQYGYAEFSSQDLPLLDTYKNLLNEDNNWDSMPSINPFRSLSKMKYEGIHQGPLVEVHGLLRYKKYAATGSYILASHFLTPRKSPPNHFKYLFIEKDKVDQIQNQDTKKNENNNKINENNNNNNNSHNNHNNQYNKKNNENNHHNKTDHTNNENDQEQEDKSLEGVSSKSPLINSPPRFSFPKPPLNFPPQLSPLRMAAFRTLQILRGDITNISCDAIVLPCDLSLLGSSTLVAKKIHEKAGKEMMEVLRKNRQQVQQFGIGGGVVTRGFRLPARHVIHVAGPVFYDYIQKDALVETYYNCLKMAQLLKLRTVCFPSIGTGAGGYPKLLAAQLFAYASISFLMHHFSEFQEFPFDSIAMVCWDRESPQTDPYPYYVTAIWELLLGNGWEELRKMVEGGELAGNETIWASAPKNVDLLGVDEYKFWKRENSPDESDYESG